MISNNTNELIDLLRNVRTQYVMLHHTADPDNMSKVFPLEYMDIMIRDFSGSYETSVVAIDASTKYDAMRAAFAYNRNCVTWGPESLYDS